MIEFAVVIQIAVIIGEKLPAGDPLFHPFLFHQVREQFFHVGGVLDRVDGVDVSALRLLVMEVFKSNSQGFSRPGAFSRL